METLYTIDRDTGILSIENAQIPIRNFSGREGKYNRAGDRNFVVRLNPEVAQELLEIGWNVRVRPPREEGDEPMHYLAISVSYKTIPPNVIMVTNRKKTPLDEDVVDTLDFADIRSADLIINPYHWEIPTRDGFDRGIKAYLKTGYFVIEVDEFAAKYE